MRLSDKQKAFWNEPYHRWNVKHGATRSGKTYLDYFVIPRSIRERRGKEGLIVLMGNTKGTLQRNVIEPMQDLFGIGLVSSIRSDNTATLFGERVHCLGADNKKHVDRLRGSSIKYCYGDEVVTWEQEVFEMLKSRLDKPYSRFDGTCNPAGPDHWFKQFIDGDADIFAQQYSIDDNPFLDDAVRVEMKKEHTGIFYDRYILGLWVAAEGLIYTQYAANKQRYAVSSPKGLRYINVGFDVGGNKSAHAFVASGITPDWKLVALRSARHKATGVTVDAIIGRLGLFCQAVEDKYGTIDGVYIDNAEAAIVNTARERLRWPVYGCIKGQIIDRIRTEDLLLSTDRLKLVSGDTEELSKALCAAVWDDKAKGEDVRLDDFSYDLDVIDAFEYSWTPYIVQLLRG